MKNTPQKAEETRGRKSKPEALLHSARIVVKVTPSELSQFTESAGRQGKAVSTWLRDLAIAAR